MKRNTLTLVIFAILFLAACIPFGFTESPEPYVFGWLPFPLLYWWILVGLNFVFLLWTTYAWLKEIGEKRGGRK